MKNLFKLYESSAPNHQSIIGFECLSQLFNQSTILRLRSGLSIIYTNQPNNQLTN